MHINGEEFLLILGILVIIGLYFIFFSKKIKITVTQIGHLNSISARNIDFQHGEYVRLATYVGDSKNELEKTDSLSIEDALNKTIKEYPGGEFLTNVKIYAVTKSNTKNTIFYAISGDVWGLKGQEQGIKGFTIGDTVLWKKINLIGKTDYISVEITGFKDSETVVVKNSDGNMCEVKIDNITKSI